MLDRLNKKITSSSGNQKTDNKTMLPYVEMVVNYLLTGKVNISQSYIKLDRDVQHLNLEFDDIEVNNILNEIRKIMKLRDKDTTPRFLQGCFT